MLQLGPNLRSLARRKMTLFLIITQIAIATCIISNLSFIIRVLQENMEYPTGIDHARLFSLMLRPADGKGVSYQQVQSDLVRISDINSVESAAAVRWAPLGFLAQRVSLTRSLENDAPTTQLQSVEVSPTALRTLGLSLRQGRDFSPGDMATAGALPNTAIITATAAEALFGDAAAALEQTVYNNGHPYQIIGVTEDWAGFTRPPFGRRELTLFLPFFDDKSSEWRYLVRSQSGDTPPELIESTVQLLSNLYQNRIMIDVEIASLLFAEGFSQDTVFKNLFIVLLCFLSFVISLAIGGQTSFWVNEQRRNLGIRRAIGASRLQVVALVLVQNLFMALPGLLAGSVLALWLAGIIQSIATTLPPMAPGYLLATCVVLLALVLASAAVPAWKAANIAPSVATRRI